MEAGAGGGVGGRGGGADVGGGGGGGDVGVGAVAEGQLCSLEGGEGGGEADQDGSEWQVELSLCLNYSAIFVTGINSTGAT